MSRAISARLMTLCGCVKFITVLAPAPAELRVPIRVSETGLLPGPDFYRTFKLRTFRPVDAPVEADYVEVFD